MTNEQFIAQNKKADVIALALAKVPVEIDLHYCLQQIEGHQIACRKLPSWARVEGITYPMRLSLEQCSSEQTAIYKQQLVQRLLPGGRQNMADLTGGFGIDFSFLARVFDEADYVEHNDQLCKIARHNFALLGLKDARVHKKNSEEFSDEMSDYSLIYLDPSRRDANGRKVVALSDCSPNIEALQYKLLRHAPLVVVKLSPMLDIQDSLRRLPDVREVHVVSVDGECKEVLLVLSREKGAVTYHCINITKKTETFRADDKNGAHKIATRQDSAWNGETIIATGQDIGWRTESFITDSRNVEPIIAQRLEQYLYEPNASILKAGVQDALCQAYDIRKLHPFSHLFTSPHFIRDFPGRSFVIENYCGFAKKDLKRLMGGLSQCNLTIRNFPSTVAELRKRLKLREGGDHYLFATTLSDESHALLRCRLPN